MSLAKKFFAFLTALSVVVMLTGGVGPVRAQDNDLAQQLANLQQLLTQLCQSYYETTGEVLSGCESYVAGGEQPTPPTVGTTYEGIPEGFTFEKNLKIGMYDQDVVYLKKVLDVEVPDHQPWTGSPYFGPKTKAAVIAFQEKYADDILAPWGLTHGTGFVGSTTRAKLNELLSAQVTPPTPTACSDYTTEEECISAGCYWYEDACHSEEQPAPSEEAGLTVTLAEDTPAAGVLVENQGLADLVHFTFTNGDRNDVKVTQLKVKRGGVSNDSVISNLYLYKGVERLTDPVTLSSGYALFNDPSGLFTIPAGESVTIAIKADIATGSGQTVNLSIESADDITSDATAVTGDFPLTGNTFSIASATLTTADFTGSTSPSGGSVDPGETGFTVWKRTLSVSGNSVYLKYLRLKEIGSIESDDLQNFKLYVNGQEIAGPVQMSDDFYVTFDLTSSPVTLEPGSRIIEVRADIIDGSGKSFSFSLWYSSDIVLVDSQYNVALIPKVSGGAFTPVTTGTVDINSGDLSVTVASDSPSGTVIINGSDVTLAKYTLTAYGEKIKVMNLKVKFTSSNANVTKLRNGKLYADGIQVGSTQDISKDGTTYNLGSSLIVEPGSPVTLEVKADIYDNDGTNDISANDTLTVTLMAGSNNGQRMTSMTLLNVPGSDLDAYTVTVGEGDLILSANSAYGDQTTIAGKTAYKVGSYVLTSANEDVTLDQFTVDVTAANGGDVSHLSNMYVVYGSNQTDPKATVSSSNSFTISYAMPSGTQLPIDIYADISSGAPANATYQTKLTVSGTAQVSGNAVTTGSVTGQTITIGTASLSAALDSGTPDASLVVAGNSDVLVAKYKFTATNADITLKDVYIAMVDSNAENSVVSAKLDLNNDGTPDTPAVYLTDGSDYGYAGNLFPFTGGNVIVPANESVTIGVYLTLNDVTTNGDSGDNVAVKLVGYKYNTGVGADQTPGVNIPGNDQIIRRTVPTVELASNSPSGALTAGAKTPVLSVNVSADSAYEVQVKSISFTPVINNAGNAYVEGGDGIYVYDAAGNLKGSALNQGENGASAQEGSAEITVDDASIYQVGERITVTDPATSNTVTQYITTIDTVLKKITIDTPLPSNWNGNGTPNEAITVDIDPAGYYAGYAYQIDLTNFVVAAGGTETLTVKADTTGLSTSGDYYRLDIDSDTSAGTTGNFVWRDGADTNDINGYLVKSLPITGNTLVTQ